MSFLSQSPWSASDLTPMIQLLRTNLDYVAAMHSAEFAQSPNTTTVAVASFLSSIYFGDDALNRFFAGAKHGAQIATLLIERKRLVRSMLREHATYRRTEVYELDAISRLVRQGRPHEQERAFHLFPSEIDQVLETMLDLLSTCPGLKIVLTRKVVPLDYLVFSDSHQNVLVDIRSNYDYQTIQGLHVCDEREFADNLRDDVRLLVDDDTTIADCNIVRKLIEQGLQEWRTGAIALTIWPEMLKTDFN